MADIWDTEDMAAELLHCLLIACLQPAAVLCHSRGSIDALLLVHVLCYRAANAAVCQPHCVSDLCTLGEYLQVQKQAEHHSPLHEISGCVDLTPVPTRMRGM